MHSEPPDGRLTSVGSGRSGEEARSWGSAGEGARPPDVIVVRWPEENDILERLRREGTPRLVLVAPDEPAPPCGDCEEDWIRLPASDADVRTRLVNLARRAAHHTRVRGPEIDGAGRLRYLGRWVALSRTEQRLARVLIDQAGSVAGYDVLQRYGWPDGGGSHDGPLRVQILRLRRRLEPLGLSIRTVPGHGYVLEPKPWPRETVLDAERREVMSLVGDSGSPDA